MLQGARNPKMISQLLSENEFRKELALWLLEHDRGMLLPSSMTKNEFAESFTLPDFEYVHTQSYADKNGDLITMLKSGVYLNEWETRNGKKPEKFEFYKIIRTLSDTPEVEPFPMGYIIVL